MIGRYAFLIALSAATAHIAAGQTLDNGSCTPVPGETLTVNRGAYVGPGPSGMAQTWNHASLTATATNEVEYVTPASTGFGGSFPGSTVAQVEPTQVGTYAYYMGSANGFHQLGIHQSSTSSTLFYQNSEKVIPYPCSYGTTWTDDFSCSTTLSGVPVMRSGTVSGTADAFGNLVMPYGTISNVLRLHVTEDYMDDLEDLYQIEYDSEMYMYYKPGVHLPILNITIFTASVDGFPSSNQYTQWISAEDATSVAELLNNTIGIDVFPNPAQDNIDLVFSSEGGAIQMDVLDVNGRIVLSEGTTNAVMGLDRRSLDIISLPAGIYHVRILAANGQQGVRRFVKQ